MSRGANGESTTAKYFVRVGGSTTVEAGSVTVDLRPRERSLVAAIAFDHPRPVPTARVAALMWGSAAPPTARQSIHNHVNRLRSAAPGLVVTGDAGYTFASGTETDAHIIERSLAELGKPARLMASVSAVVERFASGEPFSDLFESDDVLARRRHLSQLLADVEDLRIDAALNDGDNTVALAWANRSVLADPYRERRWWQLALAQARLGRRRDALNTIDAARQALQEVGLSPGAAMNDLQRLILEDDPALFTAEAWRVANRELDPGPIGVDRYLRHIERALTDSAAPPSLLLLGPPGAGKTTVASAASARALAAGTRVLSASCRADPTKPLEPVIALVDQIAATTPEAISGSPDAAVLGALSPTLAAVVGQDGGMLDRHRLLTVIERLFASMDGPTLVIVEDVHWAPPRTVEALRIVVATAGARAGGAVAVVLTARDEHDNATSWPVEVLRVEPWGIAEVTDWLAARVAEPDRVAEIAPWMLARTGGLPLFVRELTNALLADGSIGAAAPAPFVPPTTVPGVIAMALASRVARLSASGRQALEAVAVLGARFKTAHAAAMLEDRFSWLTEARQAGLLIESADEPDALAFQHDLLHQVVVGRLPPAALTELHDVAFTVLPAEAPAAERARHAVGAAAIDRHRAVSAAISAAHEAMTGYFRIDAAEWLLAASELIAGDDDDAVQWCSIRIDAGEQLLHGGDTRAAEILFDAAACAERLGELHLAARAAAIVCRLGPTSAAGASDPRAADLSNRLLDQIHEPGQRAGLAAAATIVYSMSGDTHRCRALYEQAEADAAADDTDEVWAEVLPYAYQSIAGPDDLDRREVAAAQLATVGHRLGRVDAQWEAHHLAFSNQIQRGDPTARQTVAELECLAPRVREQSRDWEMHYVRAIVCQLDDDLEGCEFAVTDSLRYADTIAASRVMAVYGVQLLSLRFAQRRLRELVDTIAVLADEQSGVGAWRAALALAAAQAGRGDVAESAFDLATADDAKLLARDQTYSAALFSLGEAAIELGDAHRAAIIEPFLIPLATRWSWAGSCTLGPLDTTLAGLAMLAGDRSRAAQFATNAAASAAAMSAPGFERAALTRLPLARP